jgi:hypothetical protein
MDTKARTVSTVAIIIALLSAVAGISAWLHLSDTGGTATPVILANQAGTGRILELRDASTPVVMVNDGGALDLDGAGGLDVDTAGAISLDADTASNFNTAGAGIDITIEAEAGRLILKGDEAAAAAVHIDANDAVTTGLDIDVGSVTGATFDGGLLDIGGGTCGVADGDNDVCIAAVLEVDGELEADGAIDADAGLTVDGGVTNIGGGSPGTAAGDNDLYVTADLEVDGTLVLATGRFPLQYASSGQSAIATSQDITGTATVAHGLTTVTWAVCTLGEDPTSGGGDSAHVSVAVSGNVVTVKAWQDDFVTAATEADTTTHCLVIGTP